MKKIHGSKNKRWKCQHLSCLNMLLIIQIFLPWSQWLQNESLYFLPQMKTEFLLLSNPMCFHPNYEKRRSRGGQMRCSQWNNNVRWQWWFFNMSTANSCFYPTFYFMIPPTAMLCVLSPPTPHTSPDMTDGRNDKKLQEGELLHLWEQHSLAPVALGLAGTECQRLPLWLLLCTSAPG